MSRFALCRKSLPLLPVLCFVAVVFAGASATRASETDQFTLPDENNFADIGPQMTAWYYEALEGGVARANAKIAEGMARHVDPGTLEILQSEDSIVGSVDGVFLRGNDIVNNVENALRTDFMQQTHPDERIFFREICHDIYEHAFSLFDFRVLSRFYIGSTVKAFGTYFGADKFGHFSAIGVSYYWSYHVAMKQGSTETEALRLAVANGTTGYNSESGILGLTTTGDYSNADLSANYSGFLFFRNLTSPVFVHGKMRPPLLQRNGPFWMLAPHVTRHSDFFAPFVSEHWNEALNPGWFVESMRPALHDAIFARRKNVLRYYTEASVVPTVEYFRLRRQKLQTYWGDDYGHRGDDNSLVDIANSCFIPSAAGSNCKP